MNQHFGTVEALALSHDGKNAVTQSHDHVLHLWNVVDGTEIKRVQLTDRIDRASFSEDGKILAVAGYGDQLHIGIWDAVHLTVLREWKVSSELDGRPTPSRRCVFALSLSANGQRLAVRDYAWATKNGGYSCCERSTCEGVSRHGSTGKRISSTSAGRTSPSHPMER